MIMTEAEALQLSGRPNLLAAARWVCERGPAWCVIKKGEHGAMLLEGRGGGVRLFAAPAFPVERVVDPTGAGDTFAGGMMGALARAGAVPPGFEELRRAVCVGTVLASFNVEDFGLDRLRRATAGEIAARYRE